MQTISHCAGIAPVLEGVHRIPDDSVSHRQLSLCFVASCLTLCPAAGPGSSLLDEIATPQSPTLSAHCMFGLGQNLPCQLFAKMSTLKVVTNCLQRFRVIAYRLPKTKSFSYDLSWLSIFQQIDGTFRKCTKWLVSSQHWCRPTVIFFRARTHLVDVKVDHIYLDLCLIKYEPCVCDPTAPVALSDHGPLNLGRGLWPGGPH